MKVKEYFTNIAERFNNVFKRFLLPCIYLCLITLALVVSIIIEYDKEDLAFIIMALIIGLLVSLLIDLFNEYFDKKIFSFISIIFAVGCFFLLHFYHDNQYVLLGYGGFTAALLCLSVALAYDKKNQPNLFGYIFSKVFFSILLCSVLSGGISLCILAFQLLIYEFKDIYKLYLIILSISEIAVCGILILSYIPKKNEEITISSSYRTIINKVALAIYFLLMAVLYIYLGKIIITADMPSGRINWFASIALLFYCFFYLSCQSQQTVLERFFCKFGGLLMLPVIAVQGYAVYIRISAYGLTPLRYLSLLFDLIGIVFVINSLVKYPVRYSIITMAVIMLLSCVGPFNFLDLPFRQQNKMFENVLVKNNMLHDGKIIPSKTISGEDKEIIISTYDYLRYADSNLHSLAKEIKESDFEKTFGFKFSDYTYDDSEYHYCYFSPNNSSIDVFGYSTMEKGYGYYNQATEAPEELLKLVKQLIVKYDYDSSYNGEPISYQSQGVKYIVDSLSFTVIDETEIERINISYYKLY